MTPPTNPLQDDLDPDRTRVRAATPRTAPRPVNLEDISLTKGTLIPGVEDAVVRPRAERDEPAEPEVDPAPSSLSLTLAATSAVLLLVALATVVYIGQRRIDELTARLGSTADELAREQESRQAADRKGEELSQQIAELDVTLRTREESLATTSRQAQRLRETGEKTKAELGTQIESLEAQLAETTKRLTTAEGDLAAAREDLDDSEKARALDRDDAARNVAALESSLASLDRLKDDLKGELDETRRRLDAADRKVRSLGGENDKLKGDQAREAAAVKKLLVQLTDAREDADTERTHRKALEDQLRRNGIDPVSPPPPEHRTYRDDDVGERDLR